MQSVNETCKNLSDTFMVLGVTCMEQWRSQVASWRSDIEAQVEVLSHGEGGGLTVSEPEGVVCL